MNESKSANSDRLLGRKFVAALSATAVLSACSASEVGTSDTSSVSLNTVESVIPGFDIEAPVDINVYRMHQPGEESIQVSDQHILSTVNSAERYIDYDLDGGLGEISVNIQDVTFAANDIETMSGEPCFTTNELLRIKDTDEVHNESRNGSNVVEMVISDDAGLCRVGENDTNKTPNHAAAFAAGQFMFFSQDVLGETYVNPAIFMHEFGHVAGLSHERELECERPEDNYNPTDYGLTDIGKIGTERKCSVVVNEDGSEQDYASRRTIMSGKLLTEDGLEDGIIPAYSTVDKANLHPDRYKINSVDAISREYELQLGPDAQNGISIDIPSDHPLKALHPDITKIMATLEITSGSVSKSERFKNFRTCGEDNGCDLFITASNDDGSIRYQLPLPVGYYETDEMMVKSVVYIDERLGIGIELHRSKELKYVAKVVSIDTVYEHAMQQAKVRADLYECYEKTDESGESTSDC